MKHPKGRSEFQGGGSLKCPICGRPLPNSKAIDKHHLVPKSEGGRDTVLIHRICHTKIHKVFKLQELHEYYHTPERIRAHPEMVKFIKWVRKQPVHLVARHR